MSYFAPRDVATSVKCPHCHHNLHINRSCKEVNMHCPVCRKEYPLRDFINVADEAMEKFLENVYFDRL